MYSLKIEIQGLPKTINAIGRKHWAVKMKEAQYWKATVGYSVADKRPPKPLKKARIVFIRYSSIPTDPDNLTSGFKHVLDGLICARVIENDKYVNIGMPEYRWERAKPREGKIRIEVYEVT